MRYSEFEIKRTAASGAKIRSFPNSL